MYALLMLYISIRQPLRYADYYYQDRKNEFA